MIPWLLVAALICETGETLAQLVAKRIQAFPCSGEINYRVADVYETLSKVREHYLPRNPVIDETDGISLEFGDWRFSLRGSNTEPLLRLNVESRADEELVVRHVAEIAGLIQG
jgi:phosphomannomutase/phosphoglucomutase